ncbi:MAG: NTP transferase domain-containing protein [Krumholzibacteria bacterium]|nr:NTP transferase domain-containing protein [Candidatus Krumholzibacteria bacterium]
MNDRRDRDGVEAVVLAAGKGTRMKSDLAKVLHRLEGRPLLDHVLDTVAAVGIGHTVVVVGHQADAVRAACARPGLDFVLQQPQLGTGHAVQVAVPALRASGYTVVLAGDVPLLRPATLARLVDGAAAAGAAATVLTCVVPDAGAYGRIVKDGKGRVARIVEARDATPAELAIGEYNTGVFCYRTERLVEALANLTTDNVQGEYYLTDTVAWLVGAGDDVAAVVTDDPGEVVGINTVDELAAAGRLLRARGR